MSKKNLLLGLGTGVILSSIVFYIAFVISFRPVNDEYIISKAKELNMIAANEIPQPETLSNEDIISRAKELGMMFESDITIKNDEMESVEDTQQSEITSVTPIDETETTEIIDIRILPGSSAVTISKTLHESGVIDNSEDFLEFLKQNNKANTIRAGYFKIPIGSSNQDILKILTTPPKKQTR